MKMYAIGVGLVILSVGAYQHRDDFVIEDTTLPIQPIPPDLQNTGTIIDFHQDPESWRTYYGSYAGTCQDFAGEYRTPFCDHFAPYRDLVRFETHHGGKVISLPQDKNKLHLTIIYRSDTSDVPSAHVRNMFTTHPWLNWFLRNSHYQRCDDKQPRYEEFLEQYISRDQLPAILVTRPKAGTREYVGEVVMFAPKKTIPINADELAYMLAQQLAKHLDTPAKFEWPVDVAYSSHDPFREYEQDYAPNDPEPELLAPLPPVLPDGRPTSPLNSQDIALVLAAGLLAAGILVAKKRKV